MPVRAGWVLPSREGCPSGRGRSLQRRGQGVFPQRAVRSGKFKSNAQGQQTLPAGTHPTPMTWCIPPASGAFRQVQIERPRSTNLASRNTPYPDDLVCSPSERCVPASSNRTPKVNKPCQLEHTLPLTIPQHIAHTPHRLNQSPIPFILDFQP